MSDNDDDLIELKTALTNSRARPGHRQRVDFLKRWLDHDAPIVTVVDDGDDVIIHGTIKVQRHRLGDVLAKIVDDGEDIIH
jgi:hypothetical protein